MSLTITRDMYWSVWWQALQEDGDGPDQQNVFSTLYVDGPILTDRGADSTTTNGAQGLGLEERSYAQADAIFNTTSLTDTAGTVMERYYFNAYGTVTIYDGAGTTTRSASSYDFKYLFQGARYDSRTGLYDLRHRDYLPGIERFFQQDPNPAGQYNDGANLYQLERSNPVSNVDPNGLAVVIPPAAIIGAFPPQFWSRLNMNLWPKSSWWWKDGHIHNMSSKLLWVYISDTNTRHAVNAKGRLVGEWYPLFPGQSTPDGVDADVAVPVDPKDAPKDSQGRPQIIDADNGADLTIVDGGRGSPGVSTGTAAYSVYEPDLQPPVTGLDKPGPWPNNKPPGYDPGQKW